MFSVGTGKSMTSEQSSELTLELVEKLFFKHHALFVDDKNGRNTTHAF